MQFRYFLADRLRMPVAELEDRVSWEEYVHWSRYWAIKRQAEELERKKAGV